jgi:hypothetical protein
MTAYVLAGLRILSDLPLSGLLPLDQAAPSGDFVRIRRAAVPESLVGTVTAVQDIAYDGKELLITVPTVARFLVREGREILVDPAPDADANDVRAYLLGSAFGSLCHQRGIVPLHSAAIDSAGGCVAFIGRSGVGKSTLVAALVERGHQLIADDVSFLRVDRGGDVLVWPGIGRIRLWEDAVMALGRNGAGVEREFRGYNKYLVPVPPPLDPFSQRRLCRVYQLHTAPSGTPETITRMHGAAAVELLMQNIYCSSIAACMGRNPAAFTICTTIARQVPVYQFARARNFDVFDAGIDHLERHLANVGLA